MAPALFLTILAAVVASCHGRGIPPGLRQHVQSAAVAAAPTIVFDAGDPDSVVIAGDSLAITLTRTSTGRARTSVRYPPGTTFSARAKCPAGDTSGLVSSLYLSSLEGSKTQDEIDFEWLGNSKSSVQLNYYVNGAGGHEKIVALGFDCSADFHTYTVYYGADRITWWIDGAQVHEVAAAAGQPFPSQAVYFYQSIWDASGINGGSWAGTASWAQPSYTVAYNGFSVQ